MLLMDNVPQQISNKYNRYILLVSSSHATGRALLVISMQLKLLNKCKNAKFGEL